MGNAAVLIAAIAGLITSLTGFIGMIAVVRRTSPRERRDAAEAGAEAAEKVLMPPNPVVDLAAALDQDRGDDDGPGTAGSNRRRGGGRP